jgi:DNA polymerase I-like protein with 3'-5' exonuclease and polymerase domains
MSLGDALKQAGVQSSPGTLSSFLGALPVDARADWKPCEPPSLDGINDIILNFETNGLDWAGKDEPIAITVGTLDGLNSWFLPFGFQGEQNLDRGRVVEWYQRNVRGKRITNANTKFEVHMSRKLDHDLEDAGNTVSDVQHYAALLDDHRKRFAIDVLAKDFLGGIEVPRIDESRMADHHPWQVAARAEYQVKLVAQLRNVMWPMLDAEDLQRVRQLEDDVIYPLCEMERNGCKLDVPLLEQMHKQCVSEHQRLLWEVIQECGFSFDGTPGSWQRLFERFKIPIVYKKNDKGDTVETFAEGAVAIVDHPVIQKAHHAAQFASLDSKVFKPYLAKIDSKGILRYEINQLREEKKSSDGLTGGTASGRFSIGYVHQVPNHSNHHAAFTSSELASIEACSHADCNLFPRRLFIAESGSVLAADAAQIEYRIFAERANNPKINAAYKEDPRRSFHKLLWAMIKVYKPNMLYERQKSLNFLKMYAGGPRKAALQLGFITAQDFAELNAMDYKTWTADPRMKETLEIEAIYAREMPEVKQLQDLAGHLSKSYCDDWCNNGQPNKYGKSKSVDYLHTQVMRNGVLEMNYPHRGFIRTWLGRRSRFPDNYNTYRGLNRVIQGTAADINKQKIVEVHRERKRTGFLLRLTKHDEIMGDAQTPETKKMVEEILDRQTFPFTIPILWDAKEGPTWAHCK